MDKFQGVEIFEQNLLDAQNNIVGKLTILRGGFYSDNPSQFMDAVVNKYVEGKLYNQFIEKFLDNPWVRVIITGINDLPFKEYAGGE